MIDNSKRSVHRNNPTAGARQQLRGTADYDFVKDLTDADLAWEFLRRNPDFQRDMRETQDASLSMTT